MDAKQLLEIGVSPALVAQQGALQMSDSVARSLRIPTDSVPEVRKEISIQRSQPPRGHLINGVNPIQRQPVHVTLPSNFEVTLYTDKFLPSVVNPNQAIAQKRGDVVIVPKDTVVTFEGQTMTLIASAPSFGDSDRGYVRIYSDQLYTNSNKPIRFSLCPGKTPVGTQFQLKSARATDQVSSEALIEGLQSDLGMHSGAVIIDRRAA